MIRFLHVVLRKRFVPSPLRKFKEDKQTLTPEASEHLRTVSLRRGELVGVFIV